MVELSPSNEYVARRLEELEGRLHRVAALVASIYDRSLHLPPSFDAEVIQTLAKMLDKEALPAMGDILWLQHSLSDRAKQIQDILLKSVA